MFWLRQFSWIVPAAVCAAALPAVEGIDISGMGQPERAPLLVTKTLLFGGDGSGMFSSGPGGGGPLFRALDKATGETLHEMELPANENRTSHGLHGWRQAIHRGGYRQSRVPRRTGGSRPPVVLVPRSTDPPLFLEESQNSRIIERCRHQAFRDGSRLRQVLK